MRLNRTFFLSLFFYVSVGSLSAQFGPIGFDFKDPYVVFDQLKFAVRLSTEGNIYAPDKEDLTIAMADKDELIVRSDLLSAAGGQLSSPGKIEMRITRLNPGRFSVTAKASHPTETCKSLLILIKGIAVDSMISEYPQAKGVQVFNKQGGIRVSYPSRAATMPLVFLPTPEKEWYILSKDKEIRRKGFASSWDHISKEPIVILSHEEDTRKQSQQIEAPAWRIGYGQSRLSIVEERCKDLEEHFQVSPYQNKAHTPWIDSLQLVTFFHGIHWTGHMFNTYDQMGEQLEWICKSIDGKRVMAFLPAWDGRYYVKYPEHAPDERMGGKEGLQRLVERAHKLGVKVVLMLGGPNLATFEFLDAHDMRDAALKDSKGNPQLQNWLDWNTDLSIETMGLIMNFGHPKYRQYMIDKTAELFDTYEVDGIFLDGTLRWDNSPDYSAYEGLIQYTQELRKRYPEKMLMGEDGYDAIYGLFDLFHTSAGPLGLENYMLRYTRQFYYLSYPAENGSSGVHELGWSRESHTINKANPAYTIPSLSLFYGDIEKYEARIKAKLEAAKNWKLPELPIMKTEN